MEPRFGVDFSQVRVHTDSRAEQSARALSADAYTTGRDIYFARGKYAPNSRLMAHELAHVVQQSDGQAPSGNVDTGRSDPLEQQADRAAYRVMNQPAPAQPARLKSLAEPRGAAKIQRQPSPDADSGQPAAFNAEAELKQQIETINFNDPWRGSRDFRILLLLEHATATWTGQEAFDQFVEKISETAYSVEETLKALDNPALTDPERIALDLNDRKTAAPGLRLLLLLQIAKPAWTDRAGFAKLLQDTSDLAATEDKTIEFLALPDLADPGLAEADENTFVAQGNPEITLPEAFPVTWSQNLEQYFRLNTPDLQSIADAKWAQLSQSGLAIPDQIFEHGLPVDFVGSLVIKSFQLTSLIGISFMWTMTPDADLTDVPDPLRNFTACALDYLRAANDVDFANFWYQLAPGVIEEVRDGELTIDPKAFFRYKQLRPHGIEFADLPRSGLSFKPLEDKFDPVNAEALTSGIAAGLAFATSFARSNDVVDMAARYLAQADAKIAGESGWDRIHRSGRWGQEHGFFNAALEQQWEDIKEHAAEIAEDTVKDIAIFTIIQFIPILDVLADLYVEAQMIWDAASAIGAILEAENEARNATTAVELQHAAADQAAAISSAGRQIATFVATYGAAKAAHAGVKAAGKIADKVADRAGRGGARDVPAEPGNAADEAGKAKEKQKKADEIEEKSKGGGEEGGLSEAELNEDMHEPEPEDQPGDPQMEPAICFPAGTPVSTSGGLLPIESLNEGDVVHCFDFESGEATTQSILGVVRGSTHTWVTIQAGGQKVRATRSHPFWVESLREWVRAEHLAPGMLLHCRDGKSVGVTAVTVSTLEAPEATYNLSIDRHQNFFVGAMELLVHNLTRRRFTYLNRSGYQNYILREGGPHGKIYYSGMFGGTSTQGDVIRRHRKNDHRYNPDNGDFFELVPGERTYGEARLLEQRLAENYQTIIGKDGANYRGNRQDPLRREKVDEYHEYERERAQSQQNCG